MQCLQRFLVLFVGLGLLASPALAEDQPLQMPPLSAYGELPQIEDASISPSGNRLAALLTVNGNRMLALFESGTKLINRVSVNDFKIRSIDWIGEDRVLVIYSETEKLGAFFTTDKHEFYKALILSTNPNSQAEVVFTNKRYLANAVFGVHGVRNIGGKWYGFFGAVEYERDGNLRNHFKHGRPYLYRVNLEDMSVKKIADAPKESRRRDWLVGAQGQVAATLNIHEDDGFWDIRDSQNRTLVEGKTPSGRVSLVGLGRDGASVIYSERQEGGKVFRREVSLSGGEPKPLLKNVDVERLYFDDQTGHLTGYLLELGNLEPVFFDANRTEAAQKVRKAFKQFNMRMVDWTSDMNHAIVRTSGTTDSGSWFLVDVANLKAQAFAYERNAIAPQHVGAISTFAYTASDGMEMDGILTLPPGKKPENLPLVMLPHGGPHAHDSESFDWWAQAFASRGYAVFQPNFRGSTNRNGAFRRAGYGEWGRKMQTDKSDGLAALAEAGIVDPDRVCIVGASYGGYAALAGVTLQQDIYNCAVAVAPVSDIRRMYREDYRATGSDRTTKVALLEQLGPQDRWNAVSPERNASRANAPILLIHGKDDTVVPYIHSVKMADALKDASKPHEFLTLDGEDHWLSKSETRQNMLKAAVAFVEKHNPPDRSN